jgi:hypothetical protein
MALSDAKVDSAGVGRGEVLRFYPVLSRRATLKKVAATIVTAPSTIRWIAES